MKLETAHYLSAFTRDHNTPKKLLKTKVQGFPVTIEHPKGSVRTIKDDLGRVVYEKRMYVHYGFFNKSKGRDGDEVDVMVGPVPNAKEVYVIHMLDKGPDKDARQDEDKVMMGFPNEQQAKNAFFLHYPQNFFGGMTTLPLATFKKKLAEGSKPYRRKKITAGV